MTDETKHIIADSFPKKFEQFDLNLKISTSEFNLFENGNNIEKSDFFVIDDILYYARDWNICVYKVFTKKQNDGVELRNTFVNRDSSQYRNTDIESDKILLLELIQIFLGREDIYVDPRLQIKSIKDTINKFDPKNNCSKSIGSMKVGLTLQIHRDLISHRKDYCTVKGFEELEYNIKGMDANEELLSLYLQNRQNKKDTITFYFDKEGHKVLGSIITMIN